MSDPGRSGRLHRLSRVLLVSGLLVAVVGLPASSGIAPRTTIGYAHLSTHGPPGGAHVLNLTINATDQPAFDPSSLTAVAGDSISLTVVNTGSFNHTFTLSRQANYTIPTTLSPPALTAYFQANGSLVDVPLPAGQTTVVNFSLPLDAAGGSFEFVSVVAYQFQAGMHGFLNVSTGSAGAVEVLQVNTTDQLSFVPDVLSVNSTGPVAVAIQVINIGSFAHTFTVVPQSNVSVTSGNFTSYFQSHPSLSNVQVPPTAGATVWANFTIPTKGVFEFICEVPGHLAKGMAGELYVGFAPPPKAAPPSTSLVQPLILAGAAGLLGIGALLAGVATLTGRFPETAEQHHH